MRRFLIFTGVFLLSAVLGTALLVLVALAAGYATLAVYRHNHPENGIGAVAGGVSEAAVLLVPILCGVIGTLLALRSTDRKQR